MPLAPVAMGVILRERRSRNPAQRSDRDRRPDDRRRDEPARNSEPEPRSHPSPFSIRNPLKASGAGDASGSVPSAGRQRNFELPPALLHRHDLLAVERLQRQVRRSARARAYGDRRDHLALRRRADRSRSPGATGPLSPPCASRDPSAADRVPSPGRWKRDRHRIHRCNLHSPRRRLPEASPSAAREAGSWRGSARAARWRDPPRPRGCRHRPLPWTSRSPAISGAWRIWNSARTRLTS